MVDTVSIEASSCCASEKAERIVEGGRGRDVHIHPYPRQVVHESCR